MTTISKDYFMQVLTTQSLEGFTQVIKWKLGRYVVAFTDNVLINRNIDYIASELLMQYNNSNLVKVFDDISIWWWADFKTKKTYIDFATSVDSLDVAMMLWRIRGEKAIRDTKTMQEIRVK